MFGEILTFVKHFLLQYLYILYLYTCTTCHNTCTCNVVYCFILCGEVAAE